MCSITIELGSFPSKDGTKMSTGSLAPWRLLRSETSLM